MESALNVDNNICRICFQIHCDTISLYSEKDGSSPYEKLISNTKLRIAANDGGPNAMCGLCYKELNVFIEFLDKCERANELFLRYKENNLDVFENNAQFNEDQEKLFKEDCIDQTITNHGKINDCLEENQQLSTIKGTTNNGVKHTCQYCCKVFTRKYNLKLHIMRHSGEAPQPRKAVTRHACPAAGCDKSFTSVTNLNTHIRRHNGERPYACTECGKTFRSSTTLNDHKRIHTGAKPYMCATCGKRFTTNKLSAHMRTHAPRSPARPAPPAPPARRLACALCAARYRHRQSLNKHLRRRHGVKTSTDNVNQQTDRLYLESGQP